MIIEKKHELAGLGVFAESKKMPVYNWVYYKEGFSPRVVDYIVEEKGAILDPFCGVGTTLLRAKELGWNAAGIDASPLAVAISKAKTRTYSDAELKEIEQHAKNAVKSKDLFKWRFELFDINRAFPRRNINTVKRIRGYIERIEDTRVKEFLLTGLVSTIPMVSYIVKDGGVLKINRRKRCASAKEMFLRKIKYMVKTAKKTGPEPEVFVGSAVEIPEMDVQYVITSPPYLNNVDYTKVYGVELSLMGVDPKHVRKNMLSSFIRKKTGSTGRIPIIEEYLKDMEVFVKRVGKILHGKIAIVVADAVIHETYVPVAKHIGGYLENEGFKNVVLTEIASRSANIKPKKLNVGEFIIQGEKS